MIYKYFIQIVTLALMAAAACLGLLVLGFVVRVLWEGFVLGFTGLGWWL